MLEPRTDYRVQFFITPWISGLIVEDVVSPNGVGWRWGIGMFA